jgi:hypothetical protein
MSSSVESMETATTLLLNVNTGVVVSIGDPPKKKVEWAIYFSPCLCLQLWDVTLACIFFLPNLGFHSYPCSFTKGKAVPHWVEMDEWDSDGGCALIMPAVPLERGSW